MVLLPSGAYTPFFKSDEKTGVGIESQKQARSLPVNSFWLDRYPVTNGQFLDFVRSHPEWRKSQIKPLFTDAHYLEAWKQDLEIGDGATPDQPVTSVSWFVANAYCRSLEKSLPTTEQWEYALADGGRSAEQTNKKILDWYARPNTGGLPRVGQTFPNGFGVYGLAGLVWEWTLDFNNVMNGSELRSTGADKELFCGGASLTAADASDYAAFMRFSMRSSLKASFTTPNLGFRCAREK
jgi:formylglycine-generating enzyme required for sulfatase activity